MWITVLNIQSGEQLCMTGSESIAAQHLEPGTVYGKGWSKQQAEAQAGKRREFQLEQGGRP